MDMIARYCVNLFEEYITDDIKEICINKPEEIWTEDAKGNWTCREDSRLTIQFLNLCIRSLATTSGQEFSDRAPIISLQLPRGHRLQVVSSIYTKEKFALVIRTKRFLKHEIDDFAYGRVRNNIVSARGIANLFTHGANLLIAGGTGSGKTSFANALLDELYKSKPDLRILTIEGVAELDVMHKNYCSLLYSENDTAIGKTQVSGLLNASLRMRPDRLIVGELRSDNVSIFNRVIESGHSGTLATIHASTPEGAIDAIANNAVLAGILEFSSKEAYLGELFKSIDGVVMVKKVNHLPVVEYIEAKDIASYTNDHGNDNDNNNNIDLIGVGNAEICA